MTPNQLVFFILGVTLLSSPVVIWVFFREAKRSERETEEIYKRMGRSLRSVGQGFDSQFNFAYNNINTQNTQNTQNTEKTEKTEKTENVENVENVGGGVVADFTVDEVGKDVLIGGLLANWPNETQESIEARLARPWAGVPTPPKSFNDLYPHNFTLRPRMAYRLWYTMNKFVTDPSLVTEKLSAGMKQAWGNQQSLEGIIKNRAAEIRQTLEDAARPALSPQEPLSSSTLDDIILFVALQELWQAAEVVVSIQRDTQENSRKESKHLIFELAPRDDWYASDETDPFTEIQTQTPNLIKDRLIVEMWGMPAETLLSENKLAALKHPEWHPNEWL